ERLDERLVDREAGSRLLELAEDDAFACGSRAGRERQLARERPEQRRLAASVRPGDREALAAAEVGVDRTEAEAPALDDRMLEPDDEIAAAARRIELELELPRLERLLDVVDALEHPLGLADFHAQRAGPAPTRAAPVSPCLATARAHEALDVEAPLLRVVVATVLALASARGCVEWPLRIEPELRRDG